MGVMRVLQTVRRMMLLQIILLGVILQEAQSTSVRSMSEASWSKAVSNYFTSASLSSLALGLIHPDLPNILLNQQTAVDRRIDLTDESADDKRIDLADEANWVVALRKTLARQSTYNNVVSEMLKAVTRIVGWLLLTLTLYGNEFTGLIRRKRDVNGPVLDIEYILTRMDYITDS